MTMRIVGVRVLGKLCVTVACSVFLSIASVCVAQPVELLKPFPWKPQFHPEVKRHTQFELQGQGEKTQVNVVAKDAYGSWVDAFKSPQVLHQLSWEWQVTEQPSGANLKAKSGDDAAAKMCVFVAIDESTLSFGTRLKLGAARMVSDEALPAATLCYVWATPGAKVGELFPNPYTNLVKNLILSNQAAGEQWLSESRDVQADARRAFGDELPNGPVKFTGVALGGDSDNTHSSAKSAFRQVQAK